MENVEAVATWLDSKHKEDVERSGNDMNIRRADLLERPERNENPRRCRRENRENNGPLATVGATLFLDVDTDTTRVAYPLVLRRSIRELVFLGGRRLACSARQA